MSHADPDENVLLEARNIVKSFPGVKALSGVNLRLVAGQVHVLVGENGAGKSTLINILTGIFPPDSGELRRGGAQVHFSDALAATSAGVGVVHQEHNLIPGFTVAQNISMSHPPRKGLFIDRAAETDLAQRALTSLGATISPGALIDELTVAQLRMVEIARMLAFDSRILLLDEPTASLADREVNVLLRTIERLRAEGCAVLLVTHKLEEAYQVGDVVTVLRDGETITEAEPLEAISQTELVNRMAGRVLAQQEFAVREVDQSATPTFELDGVCTLDAPDSACSMAAHTGEIVGLYGLVGAGRSELMRAAVGLEGRGDGQVRVNGKNVTIASVRQALHQHSIAYVSEDRRGEGLFLGLDVTTNIAVTVWDRMTAWWRGVSRRGEIQEADHFTDALGIKTSSHQQVVGKLSGGNQQKVSLAKWLAADANILIIDEPTAGIDVRTKADFHRLIVNLADSGKSVIVISSDLPEMINLADRIYVMHEHRIIDELANDKDYSSMSAKVMNAIYQNARTDSVREPAEA